MKRVIFVLGIFILMVSCKKTEVQTNPPVVVVQEEAIKFTTNLDTGTYNVADTLPLILSVNSKLPSTGIIYSITATWTDSSKQIYKIDSSSTSSTLSLNIPGLRKAGNYSVSVSITSKSTATNTSNKAISVVNNPLGRFMGYKVDQAALTTSKQKDFGKSYWENLPIATDLFVGAFQKGVKILTGPFGNGKYEYSSWLFAVTLGDFNNDGWVDIFNAGAACNGKAANLSFLIWNPISKIFEENNLINSNINYIGGPIRAIPIYLNGDNYVDVVIIGHNDECSGQALFENCRILLSDGTGKYNISELQLEPSFLHNMFGYSSGDVGYINNDNYPDLILASGTHTYIFWGISTFPYFSNQNFAHFATDTINFSSNNGFGEIVPAGAGDAYRAWAADINNDGKNDLLLGTVESISSPNRFLTNLGLGRFNQTAITNLPVRSIKNAERIDYIIDDLNGDGLKDLMALDCIYSQTGEQSWELIPYIQQQNGSFLIDNSWIQYTINTNSRPNAKWKLVYADYNGDGKKDIGYIDSGIMPTLDPNNDLKKKTVLIRTGNKFIEQDYYQFDPYAKSILSTIIK
jgi:hypothetical protein